MPVIERSEVIGGAVPPRLTKKITLTAAEVRGLTTGMEVIPSPGVGKSVILDDVFAFKPAGTAFGGIAAGDDLEFRYSSDTGTEIMDIESTNFLDQTGNTRHSARASTADHNIHSNAPIILHLGGDVTGGDEINLEIFYRIVPDF